MKYYIHGETHKVYRKVCKRLPSENAIYLGEFDNSRDAIKGAISSCCNYANKVCCNNDQTNPNECSRPDSQCLECHNQELCEE